MGRAMWWVGLLLVGCGDSHGSGRGDGGSDAAILDDASTAPDGGADTGTADGGGDAAVEPPPEIDPERTRFTRYGNLRVAFREAVDPERITVALTPERPSGLVPGAVTAVGDDVVDVAIPAHHLPIEYTLIVTFDSPAGPQTVERALFGNGSRVAFITEASGTGDMGRWTEDAGDGGLGAADAVCRRDATEAGLESTFAAYLSVHGETDAACRLLGSDGRVATDCGFGGGIPSDTAPYLDGAGRPILFGADAVRSGEWRLPVRLHADGTQAPESTFAWTGTTDLGTASGGDCDGWTVADAATVGLAAPGVDDRVPHASHGPKCDLSGVPAGWSFHLLCFQMGEGFFEASDVHVRTGKRAFVTSAAVGADLGGPAGADAACQDAADDAGLTGAFVAWLGDANDDAYCRLGGAAGKRADDCGLAAPPEGGPWVRADGFLVAETLEDLADGAIDSPILLDEHGAFVPITAGAVTGTDADGTRRIVGSSTFDCDGWTSSSAGVSLSGGVASGAGRSWTQYFSRPCSGTGRLYCFEL